MLFGYLQGIQHGDVTAAGGSVRCWAERDVWGICVGCSRTLPRFETTVILIRGAHFVDVFIWCCARCVCGLQRVLEAVTELINVYVRVGC